ncbi:4-(cytidine 5'-diphospho)-2-C-methyl-D-erythritol kinase [bacterium]|nr:4-(cytidine 5'-diphospho)-2-C-methyl-D-erythritol kinase [bacterium]
MEVLKLNSFAKINLHLEVLKTRRDGYHDICSILQAIDLCDIIEFEKTRSGIDIHVTGFKIPADDDNLVVKATLFIKSEYDIKEGIKIKLHKRIPIGGGLGGGSSNAVVTIIGLNKLFDLRIPYSQMRKLAAVFGADVPFFLTGGTALAKGMGDILEDIILPLDYWIVLIKPVFGVSTTWAYQNIEPYMEPVEKLNIEEVKNDFYANYKNFTNTFEKLVFSKYPVLKEFRNFLFDAGAVQAMLSGSGSTIYGLFTSKEIAEKAFMDLKSESNNYVYLCKPVNINYF